jgi:hypothetical protein
LVRLHAFGVQVLDVRRLHDPAPPDPAPPDPAPPGD